MGISTDKVEASEFEGIGDDLYYDDESGVILRFNELKKTDGKKFVESEIHRLIGTYSPVNRDGKMGLRRVNQVLADASYVVSLNHIHVMNHSALMHKQSDVVNQFRIDYQYISDSYVRSLSLTDADSVDRNDTVKEKVLRFKGLHNSRHSQSLIYSLINGLQHRYRNAPQEITVDVLPYWDKVEPGDIIKLSLDHVQDFAGSGTLSRSFEVHGVSVDWMKGKVKLNLFASSGEEGDPLLTPEASVLADAFYTSKGTDLASISPSIVNGSGHIDADCTLTGHEDVTNASAIYYYDGDLTIDSGVTVTITDNVQLRVKGLFTNNGTIDGEGGGISGATSYVFSESGKDALRGYVGAVQGTDGWYRDAASTYNFEQAIRINGDNASFPSITVDAGDQTASPVPTDISGIPTDLRGGGGAIGGRIRTTSTILQDGGDGGDGGAGFCAIARGFAFGASGRVDLSGTDGSEASGTYHYDSQYFKAGTGAGGGAGCLLLLVDGSSQPFPSVAGVFVADTGASVPPTGDPHVTETSSAAVAWGNVGASSPSNPYTGNDDHDNTVSDVDRFSTNKKIMYIPESA